MSDPKCPVCKEDARYDGDWICDAEGCDTTFIVCPICGEWLVYYSSSPQVRYPYETNSCEHVVAMVESEAEEPFWDDMEEESRFLEWYKKHEPKEEEYEDEEYDFEDLDDEDLDEEGDGQDDDIDDEANADADLDTAVLDGATDTGEALKDADDATEQEEPVEACDWDTESLGLMQVFDKYVEEQTDWFCKSLYVGNGRHGSSTTFYLKRKSTPAE